MAYSGETGEAPLGRMPPSRLEQNLWRQPRIMRQVFGTEKSFRLDVYSRDDTGGGLKAVLLCAVCRRWCLSQSVSGDRRVAVWMLFERLPSSCAQKLRSCRRHQYLHAACTAFGALHYGTEFEAPLLSGVAVRGLLLCRKEGGRSNPLRPGLRRSENRCGAQPVYQRNSSSVGQLIPNVWHQTAAARGLLPCFWNRNCDR